MRTWPTGKQLPGDLVDDGQLLLFMAEEVVDRAPRKGQRLALQRKRRTSDDTIVNSTVKRRRRYEGLSTYAALICAVTDWKQALRLWFVQRTRQWPV
jgi:hypothetical protein